MRDPRAAQIRAMLDGATLVPAPRSTRLVAGALWPPLLICQELVRAGLQANIETMLERMEPVQKAATSGIGQRPLVSEHLKTIDIPFPFVTASRIVVVDDVITKGTTLLACASIVEQNAPAGSDIAAFALIRTMGLVADIDAIVKPVMGRITLNGDEGERVP